MNLQALLIRRLAREAVWPQGRQGEVGTLRRSGDAWLRDMILGFWGVLTVVTVTLCWAAAALADAVGASLHPDLADAAFAAAFAIPAGHLLGYIAGEATGRRLARFSGTASHLKRYTQRHSRLSWALTALLAAWFLA